MRRQLPLPSCSTQARPSARITGLPLRDHFAYQNGPVARCRMKGLEEVIDCQRTPGSGRNVCPGNRATSCPRGQLFWATFLVRSPYFKGRLRTTTVRNYGNQTPVFGFPSRRSRVRGPSSALGRASQWALSCFSVWFDAMAGSRRGQRCRPADRSSAPALSGDGRHSESRSDPQGSTAAKRVSPPPPENPTQPAGRRRFELQPSTEWRSDRAVDVVPRDHFVANSIAQAHRGVTSKAITRIGMRLGVRPGSAVGYASIASDETEGDDPSRRSASRSGAKGRQSAGRQLPATGSRRA